MTDVGVVVPCRNVGAFVGDAITSLISERGRVAEIVCVDDGSNDNTLREIRAAARRCNFEVMVLKGGARGAGAARNIGLSAVTAVFCQFLDADDLLMPGKLQKQSALLNATDSSIAAGAYRLEPRIGEVRVVQVDSNAWRGLITSRLGATSSMLFRSSDVRAVGGWAEHLESSQEYDLLFRMAASGFRIVPDSRVLTTKREREGAISSSEPVARWVRFIELRQEMLAHLHESGQLGTELEDAGRQTLFRAMQKIAAHDLALASKLVESTLPAGFKPDGSSIGARGYRAAYSKLGFTSAERLRQRLEMP